MTSQLACSPFSLTWQIEKCDFLDLYFNDSDLLTLTSLNSTVNKAAICPGISVGFLFILLWGVGSFWGDRRVLPGYTLPDCLWKGPLSRRVCSQNYKETGPWKGPQPQPTSERTGCLERGVTR